MFLFLLQIRNFYESCERRFLYFSTVWMAEQNLWKKYAEVIDLQNENRMYKFTDNELLKKSIWIFYDLEFVLFDWFEIRLGTFLINCKWKSSVKMQFEFNIFLLGHGKKYYAKIGVLCCGIFEILGKWDFWETNNT